MSCKNVHFCYIIGILVLTIVLSLTVNWGGIPELVKYITFALTLTSIVLASLAIIYAFISNSSMTGSLSRLRELSDNVVRSSKSLRTYVDELKKEISEIIPSIKGVEERVEKTHEIVQSMKESRQQTKEQSPTIDEKTEYVVKSFVDTTSTLGLHALYACSLANKSKHAFDIRELEKELYYFPIDYVQGFLIAAEGIGFLTANVSKNYIYNIPYFNEDLAVALPEEIEVRIDSSDEEDDNLIKGQFEGIKEYFDKL